MSVKYRTIVADPPWHYDGYAGSVGRGGYFARTAARSRVKVRPMPYPTLTVRAIAELPIPNLAQPSAWLFLWTTNRYLHDAFHVADAWGFKYAQTIVWNKTSNVPPFGGTVSANKAEYLLICRRGRPTLLRRWPSTVIEAPKPNDLHSRKPDVFLDLIEGSAEAPRVELFARRQRLGWDTWGNEALEHVALAVAPGGEYPRSTT